MVNLHISLTPFKNESRVIKQTSSLINHKLYEKIYILALHEVGLATTESLSTSIEIHRIVLNSRTLSKGLIPQIIKYLELSFRILKFSLKIRPVVVNIHSLLLLPLACVIKILIGSSLVYDTHELETETDTLQGFRKKISKWIEKIFIRFADTIVVVSNEIRNWYITAYGCKNIITVLNCPYYVQSENTDLIRNEFGIESSKKIILYLGVISEGRGIRFILEAFCALNNQNYSLVFIGYGDLEGLVIDYKAQNSNIYLRNAVKPSEVVKYAASADIGVSIILDNCLSYTYCLPNKLFEYIMAGIPTIISDLPEMRRIIAKYNIGVQITAKDYPEFKNALLQISNFPKQLLTENLKKAAKELNWEIQEKYYLETTIEVIRKRRCIKTSKIRLNMYII